MTIRHPQQLEQVSLGGTTTHLTTEPVVLTLVRHYGSGLGERPLAVSSVNLDHLHHFGGDSATDPTAAGAEVEWLNLLDGAPPTAQARRMTGYRWPRLPGSDLIQPILAVAAEDGLSVGFLGGSTEMHHQLEQRLASIYPSLKVAGYWSPPRSVVTDPVASADLADAIRSAGVQLLFVGLGKPRQETWIRQHGARTGAGVLLAFGASADFVAGHVRRAPEAISRWHAEWLWRLAREPRRLAKRYLVQGPAAYLKLRSGSALLPSSPRQATTRASAGRQKVSAVIVTYNSSDHVAGLLDDLVVVSQEHDLTVIVVDNGSLDDTLEMVRVYRDRLRLHIVDGHGNVGYAGGINLAAPLIVGHALILNPDLRVPDGSVNALLARLRNSGAGAVVPLIRAADGAPYPSIRQEPSIVRAGADAVFGRHWARRAPRFSEYDHRPESYRFAHRVQWATGAALLIDAEVYRDLGPWNESFFLYSEETDLFRRIREAGRDIWFDPAAEVMHEQGGSGRSAALDTLLAVNRIKYFEQHHSRSASMLFRLAVTAGEVARLPSARHRAILPVLLRRSRWSELPTARPSIASPLADHQGPPIAAVIIPAHNEASVIARTLSALRPTLDARLVEVVVVCNGCTDTTAEIARSFAGVTVVETEVPGKAPALNLGDDFASAWPRLYLDADIELPPSALIDVVEALATGEFLAVRPTARHDTRHASAVVRAYYRARERAGVGSNSLWGAGVYALSEDGHRRMGSFPAITADDLFVDRTFVAAEKAVIPTEPATVTTPRRVATLVRVLRRVDRGNREIAGGAAETLNPNRSTTGTVRRLWSSVRGPSSLLDAAVYTALAGVSRFRPTNRSDGEDLWERDTSSRERSA